MASVLCAVAKDAAFGGVMNGNRSILSMPIARICKNTPSTGTPRIAGGA